MAIEATDAPVEVPVDEPYPWDVPYVHRLSGSLAVTPATPISTFDRKEPDMASRVIGIVIGDVTFHLGVAGGDSEIVEVIDKLTTVLYELRLAAQHRLAHPDPTVPA